MARVQRVLGERRYMTGVEIAIACAIASAAVAKSRNNQNTTEPDETAEGKAAAEGLKALLGEVALYEGANLASNDPSSQTANLFKRPIYMIAPSDSLVEIAERMFHNADVAFLIANINAGRLSEHTDEGKRIIELRSRQEIELPLPSEVQEFLKTKPKDIKAENLVTIVGVTEIDRELLDSFLSTIVGSEQTSGAQGEQQVAIAAGTAVHNASGKAGGFAGTKAGGKSGDNAAGATATPGGAGGDINLPAAAERPLMALLDFGRQIGSTLLMPTMEAIMNRGLNLKTYISRIDIVASQQLGHTFEPEPQR